jgi:hypothetical protein
VGAAVAYRGTGVGDRIPVDIFSEVNDMITRKEIKIKSEFISSISKFQGKKYL